MIPDLLQQALERSLEGIHPSALKRSFEHLSKAYREGRSSSSIFDTEAGRLAYLITRMPATYGAIDAVLKEMSRRMPDWRGETWLDLGAGPGTGSWAALEHFPFLKKGTLIDQSQEMIQWGKKLALEHPVLSQADWTLGSLKEAVLLEKVDLAIASYVLGELPNPAQFIETIWKSDLPLLVLIEPGTPAGFNRIKNARKQWLELGGFLIAPCPHTAACPMADGRDWCHFPARIQRSALHRYLKEGELGHEDEKFSYLIASRASHPLAANRIVRHPMKHKGFVELTLCSPPGVVKKDTISKKQGALYKEARNAEWGDSI